MKRMENILRERNEAMERVNELQGYDPAALLRVAEAARLLVDSRIIAPLRGDSTRRVEDLESALDALEPSGSKEAPDDPQD